MEEIEGFHVSYCGPSSDNLSTFTLLKQIAQIPQNLLLARVKGGGVEVPQNPGSLVLLDNFLSKLPTPHLRMQISLVQSWVES